MSGTKQTILPRDLFKNICKGFHLKKVSFAVRSFISLEQNKTIFLATFPKICQNVLPGIVFQKVTRVAQITEALNGVYFSSVYETKKNNIAQRPFKGFSKLHCLKIVLYAETFQKLVRKCFRELFLKK